MKDSYCSDCITIEEFDRWESISCTTCSHYTVCVWRRNITNAFEYMNYFGNIYKAVGKECIEYTRVPKQEVKI